MKKTAAQASFLARFQEILEALDDFEMDEALEELNAELEDALFLLEESEDAEETEGAMEEIEAIAADYRELTQSRPELSQKATELEMAIQMAKNNLL